MKGGTRSFPCWHLHIKKINTVVVSRLEAICTNNKKQQKRNLLYLIRWWSLMMSYASNNYLHCLHDQLLNEQIFSIWSGYASRYINGTIQNLELVHTLTILLSGYLWTIMIFKAYEVLWSIVLICSMLDIRGSLDSIRWISRLLYGQCACTHMLNRFVNLMGSPDFFLLVTQNRLTRVSFSYPFHFFRFIYFT